MRLDVIQMGMTVPTGDAYMRENSDIPTYRIRVTYPNKDGRKITGDFICGSYYASKRRTENSRRIYLADDLSFKTTLGYCCGYTPRCMAENRRGFRYTFADVLRVVNADSALHFNGIHFKGWDGDMDIDIAEN